ncbi:hypothetical protein HDU90_004712 [Geranomyces variabilis]|nr:hypothetical protein HDU90_004712 [Geranomyces variabilis]
MPPRARELSATTAPNPLADLFSLVANAGVHTIKLTLECHYVLEKGLCPALAPCGPDSSRVFSRKAGRGAGASQPEKKKSPMDDYRKFYLAWTIGGAYEGKSETLLWDGSPWVWSHDVQVKSSFLADLYDKPTSIQVYEIVRPVERDQRAESPGPTEVLRYAGIPDEGADTFGMMGSRVRMSGQITAAGRKMSLSALAKRQIILANSQLPARERHNLVQKASVLGFGVADPADDTAIGHGGLNSSDEALRRNLTTWQDSSPEEERHNKKGRDIGGKLAAPIAGKRPKTPVAPADPQPPLQRPNSGNSRASSPRRRHFENPDGTTLREPPQPHHFDRPDRHLSASARSRELAVRTSPEPGNPKPRTPPSAFDSPASVRRAPVPGSARPLLNRRAPGDRKSDAGQPLAPVRDASARPDRRKQEIKHELRARIDLDVSDLFWGALSVNSEIKTRVAGLASCKAHMTLSNPLLSKQQEESLNPISITMLRAESMPDKPTSYHDLSRICSPVFTKFNFFSDPHTHQSVTSQRHDHRVAFNTRHLVLAGLLDEDTLREDLLGKKLMVELHDRDLKPALSPYQSTQDLVDGSDIEAMGTGSFGVAHFPLTELASGAMLVEIVAPVLPGRDGRRAKSGARRSLPPAQWLESGTTLAVRVESKYPVLANSGLLSGGVFRRVVIVTRAHDENTPLQVQRAVEECNARALNINVGEDGADEAAVAATRAALQRYVLTDEEAGDADLDIITGHHIFDGEMRIILLEGRTEGGSLGALLASLPSAPPVRIYNGAARAYSQRLWTSLATLTHTFLARPIRELMVRTDMYLRMRTSEACFAGLDSLIKILVKDDGPIEAFPTTEMIAAFTISYGERMDTDAVLAGFSTTVFPNADAHARESKASRLSQAAAEGQESIKSSKSTLAHPGFRPTAFLSRSVRLRQEKRVDDTNDVFRQMTAHRVFRQPNFLAINVRQFNTMEPAAPYERCQDHDIYNYSIQKFSSTARQMKLLRKTMAKDHTHVYSYGSAYLSQLVPRVDYDAAMHRAEFARRRKWQSPEGFCVSSYAVPKKKRLQLAPPSAPVSAE